MGQHKNNPKSQLKKEGKLPPKPAPMGASESRRRLQALIESHPLMRPLFAILPRHDGERYLQDQADAIMSAMDISRVQDRRKDES